MNFFEFCSNNPVLTFLLALIICNGVVEIFQAIF